MIISTYYVTCNNTQTAALNKLYLRSNVRKRFSYSLQPNPRIFAVTATDERPELKGRYKATVCHVTSLSEFYLQLAVDEAAIFDLRDQLQASVLREPLERFAPGKCWTRDAIGRSRLTTFSRNSRLLRGEDWPRPRYPPGANTPRRGAKRADRESIPHRPRRN